MQLFTCLYQLGLTLYPLLLLNRYMAYLSFMTGWLNIVGAIAGLALVAQVGAAAGMV